MKTKSCVCKPATIDPSVHFYARGQLHIFTVLNLRDYIKKDPNANNLTFNFERLRGGEAFAHVISKIEPSANFIKDEKEREMVDRGHEFQVFRGHLTEDWLYPTFLLQKETVPPPADISAREWENYEFRVRLSRAGFIEVRVTKNLAEQGENIVDILQSLLELAARGDPDVNRRSLQLKLAMYCADWFVRSLPKEIIIKESNGREDESLSFQPLGERSRIPYRQRYMTMVLRNIDCHKCGRRIEADTLRDHYGKTLAAILEGVLVEKEKGKLTLPDMDEGSMEIKDLASWKDDLCVFTAERALLYFPEKRIYLFGQTGTEAVNYEHYWECIARGIEHTLAVRAALQIIEYYTTKDLDGVPALTQKVVDGKVTKADQVEISQMAQAVANTFNLLPLLRDALVPTSSYRASYAVKKFEHLNSVLNISDIEEHVERNVDELVGFVQFFASMELEDELNKNEATINRVGMVIGFVALLVAGPSFLTDYRDFFIEVYHWPPWTEWAVFGLIVTAATMLILRLLLPRSSKNGRN